MTVPPSRLPGTSGEDEATTRTWEAVKSETSERQAAENEAETQMWQGKRAKSDKTKEQS